MATLTGAFSGRALFVFVRVFLSREAVPFSVHILFTLVHILVNFLSTFGNPAGCSWCPFFKHIRWGENVILKPNAADFLLTLADFLRTVAHFLPVFLLTSCSHLLTF